MDKVRIGIIGTGGMGQVHLKTQAKIEEVTLTALCDVDAELCRRLAAEHGVPGFTKPDELLDSGLVDAVIIATPHYFHPTIGVAALRRGLHVFTEKPLGVTVKATDELIAVAKETGLKFGVNFQQRTLKAHRQARKAIEEGIVGEIYRTLMVTSWYRTQAYYDSATWRATWAGEGGGVLLNQAPHNLDMFTWLGGVPAKVTAQLRTRLHEIEVEDEAFAILEYANGAHGYLYASVNDPPQTTRMEFCGDRGKVLVGPEGCRVLRFKAPIREYTFDCDDMWGKPEFEEVPMEVPEMPTGPYATVRAFARAVLFDEPLLIRGEEGAASMELGNAIILSGKRGRCVDLPVDREEYETLMAELCASSRRRREVRAQQVSDPRFK